MHYDACHDTITNARLANRRAEWCVLILNAVTPICCHEVAWGRHGWAWDRTGATASKWLELTYFAPEILDEPLMERTKTGAPSGPWVPDHDYYIGYAATTDGVLALPASLDETIAAAHQLPDERGSVLRRAARWLKAGDRAGEESRSLHFLAIVCGMESLARDWSPDTGSKAALKKMFTELLPCYREVETAVNRFYSLRSALAHGERVLPEDWIDAPMQTEDHEFALLVQMSWVCRLVVANWIRARSGLALLPPR
jgi:hypothetical protein